MTTIITYKYLISTIGWCSTGVLEYKDYNMKDALRQFWHHSMLSGERRIDHKKCYKITDVREIR